MSLMYGFTGKYYDYIEFLRTIYHPIKYHDDITKYHDMSHKGDYGAGFHIQLTVGQYQGTLMSCHTVNITCYILLVYT